MPVPEPIIWRIHLAAEQPARTAVAVLFAVLVLGLLALLLLPTQPGLAEMLLLFGVAVLLLFAAIAEFLLPITYTLDAAGAHMRLAGSRRDLTWGQVRRVYLRRDGIKLSPLRSGGWVESYRGVLLRTRDREAVLAAVRAWLADAGVSPEFVEEA